MNKKNLQIYYSNSTITKKDDECMTITFEELVRIVKTKDFFKEIWKYKEVKFYCPSFTAFPRPFLTAVICRLMAMGTCSWIDINGNELKIGLVELLRQLSRFLYENISYKSLLKKISADINHLNQIEINKPKLDISKTPVYLRCDLSYGYIAGGSIGHIAGVVNNIEYFFKKDPFFITTDIIPTVKDSIKTHLVNENITYGNVKDISGISFNNTLYRFLCKILENKEIAFIYQRSALNAYAGIKYSLNHKIPFVLEYNGSEVWIANKWGGRKLKAKDISEEIEMLTFQKADLITCVSKPLKDQLMALNIPEEKIIVNPNGVNTDAYNPNIDREIIRSKYHLPTDKIVIGFIGTFGAWHGAEILAKAVAKIINETVFANRIHLLLVGDGAKMPEVKAIISKENIEAYCTLTGIVPQKEGPLYLAASDILVSPQVKNPDGTPFFGSPTKLFEYMAMGKPIITSNMDQMAEIFDHEKNALLCEPGDITDLANNIIRLINDKEFGEVLGKNARDEVCKNYTWKIHTEKIIEALKK